MPNCRSYDSSTDARTSTTKAASSVAPEALELYEAATALSIAKRTVRRMCLRQELPHFHIGSRGDYRILKPQGMSWETWMLKAKTEGWRCERCAAVPPEPPRSHWRRRRDSGADAAV